MLADGYENHALDTWAWDFLGLASARMFADPL